MTKKKESKKSTKKNSVLVIESIVTISKTPIKTRLLLGLSVLLNIFLVFYTFLF